MASDERPFLHDIANPISIAVGMVEICQTMIGRMDNVDPKVMDRLGKAVNALRRAGDLIQERRKILIDREEAEKQNPS